MTDARAKVDRLGVGLSPFDPHRHTPQDVGLGGPSTEYLATVRDPFGYPENIPSIWWDSQGRPHIFNEENALALSQQYEGATGKYFPRYNTLRQAEEMAMNRSARGGATYNALAGLLSENPSVDFRQIMAALLGGKK